MLHLILFFFRRGGFRFRHVLIRSLALSLNISFFMMVFLVFFIGQFLGSVLNIGCSFGYKHCWEWLGQVLNEEFIEVLDIVVQFVGEPLVIRSVIERLLLLFLGCSIRTHLFLLNLGSLHGQCIGLLIVSGTIGYQAGTLSLVILQLNVFFLHFVQASLQSLNFFLFGLQHLYIVLRGLEEQLVIFLDCS